MKNTTSSFLLDPSRGTQKRQPTVDTSESVPEGVIVRTTEELISKLQKALSNPGKGITGEEVMARCRAGVDS
jgi:hypothetical protein